MANSTTVLPLDGIRVTLMFCQYGHVGLIPLHPTELDEYTGAIERGQTQEKTHQYIHMTESTDLLPRLSFRLAYTCTPGTNLCFPNPCNVWSYLYIYLKQQIYAPYEKVLGTQQERCHTLGPHRVFIKTGLLHCTERSKHLGETLSSDTVI